MADMLGTSKQVISRYETKQRIPKLSTANEYAKKLGVTLSELSGSDHLDVVHPINWSSPLTTAYAAAVRPTQDAVCAVLGIDYVDPKKSTPAESVTKVTPLQPSKPQPERDNSFFIAARTADGKPIKLPTEAPEGLDEFLADALARSNPPEDL